MSDYFQKSPCVPGQGQPTELEPEFLEPLENFTATQGREVVFTCVVNHLGKYKVGSMEGPVEGEMCMFVQSKIQAASRARL